MIGSWEHHMLFLSLMETKIRTLTRLETDGKERGREKTRLTDGMRDQ